jgi:hypothetical protein
MKVALNFSQEKKVLVEDKERLGEEGFDGKTGTKIPKLGTTIDDKQL